MLDGRGHGRERDNSGNGPGGPGAKPTPFTPPQISLPKGGGAIRGIGEKFAANPVTGTGSLSVPIALSPGRSGFGPQLSLSNTIPAAATAPSASAGSCRCRRSRGETDKGLPQYRDSEESDIFICRAPRIWSRFCVATASGRVARFDEFERDGYRVKRYRPRIEGLFARIERWTRLDDGDGHWRSISKDNVLTVYGLDADSRIADPGRAPSTSSAG